MSDIDTFGVGRRPLQTHAIQKPEMRLSHDRWVAIASRDAECDVSRVWRDAEGNWSIEEVAIGVKYADLWSVLATLEDDRRKWWVACWRMRYVVDKAALLSALKEGEVKLRFKKGRDGKKKRCGRVTLGPNIVEFDVEIKGRKFKLVDFSNWGLEPGDVGAHLDRQTGPEVARLLVEWESSLAGFGWHISRPTAASCGWTKFRASHMRQTLVSTCDDTVRTLERDSYHGGRNEAFWLGDVRGECYSLDIRACYASICATKNVPVVCSRDYPVGLPVGDINPDDANHWCADVIVKTNSPDYPVKWLDGSVYPVGEFQTVLPWPELQHALKAGRVQKINRAAKYLATNALQGYAEYYWRSRFLLEREGNKFCVGSLKAIFNASLGFTARVRYEWVPWLTDWGEQWRVGVTQHPDGGVRLVPYITTDVTKEWLRVTGEPRDGLPLIHSTICSWARMLLLRIIEVAGKENVHYVDTDGLIVSKAGRDLLAAKDGLCGNGMGQLVERWKPGSCRIQAQKNYRLGDNFVCAGQVRTRRSEFLEREVYDCPTGMLGESGKVEPFVFECDDVGGEEQRWVNSLH